MHRVTVVLFVMGVSPAFAQPAASQPTQDAEKLRQAIREQEAAIEALSEQTSRQEREIKELREQMEQTAHGGQDAELKQLVEEAEVFEPGLRFYGFFDFNFGAHVFDEETLARLYMPNTLSFALTSVHLYADSKIAPTLGALLEIRFTYLPLGTATDYDVYLRQGDQLTRLPVSAFERVGGQIIDPSDTDEVTLGGLAIERVHLTFTPTDWFNVIAGRFITPFGIWNVDHGSPVVIGIRLPHLITRAIVPLAQTGLQIYGRLFPGDQLALDYALTISNGRGPMDAVYDLDDNKGLGLRFLATYESHDLKLAVGTYGYYGAYHDEHLGIVMDEQSGELSARSETVEHYTERAITADLLLELYGLRLQFELAYSRTTFDTPRLLEGIDRVLQTGDPLGTSGTLYKANFTGQAAYVLLAYRLPLDPWLGQVAVSPYVMYEYNNENDTVDATTINRAVVCGLNIRPLAALVLKAEYHSFTSDLADAQSFFTQAAVSF